MAKYLVLTPLVQPLELLPGKLNPKYDQPGSLVMLGDIVTDEPGGFLEHRNDPQTGALKQSYYEDGYASGWFIRIGETEARVAETMARFPNEVGLIYQRALAEQQADAAENVKNRRGRKSADIEPEAPRENPIEEPNTAPEDAPEESL